MSNDNDRIKLLNKPTHELQLSGRAWNILEREGIRTIGELIAWSESDLLNLQYAGVKSIAEIKSELEKLGLSLAPHLTESEIREQLRFLESKTMLDGETYTAIVRLCPEDKAQLDRIEAMVTPSIMHIQEMLKSYLGTLSENDHAEYCLDSRSYTEKFCQPFLEWMLEEKRKIGPIPEPSE